MVLRRPIWVLACLAAGCLPRAPMARLPHATPIAVAYVFDPESGREPSDVPDAVKAKVAEALADRNLQVELVPLERYSASFAQVRDSGQRFREIAKLSEAPLVMLIETRASFFSQLTERYRWNVYGRVTVGKRDRPGEPASRQFDDAAFLDFDHEREPAALSIASGTIAKRAGQLLDEVLAGDVAPTARAPRARPVGDAIYFVMIDRFADGDPSNDVAVDRADPQAFHGGDLQGVLDHLDELQKLGVRTVWLSPVFQMRHQKFHGYGAFHGYWVEDFGRVEPSFGTEAKLAELSDALHARGMRLMLDVVLNHVAMDAPLLKEHPDWFHREGPLTDWNDPVQLTRRDVKGLPDLAQENEEVYRYLLDTSLGWIDRVHPDGFRLDAVKHVPLSFWARYDDALHARAGRDFELLGEELEGDPAKVAHVQRDGHFDAMFDFPLHFALVDVFCKDQPPERLGAVLSNDRLYDDPASLVTLVDNHDLPRIWSACGGEARRVEQALTFQLTARGTPALTYGTEAGLAGASEPENRADMKFEPGGELRETISHLLALRREHPALQTGAPWILQASGGVFAYARVAPSEAALIVVNHRDVPAHVDLPAELAALPWADPVQPEPLDSARDRLRRGPSVLVRPGEVQVFFAQGALDAVAARLRAQWLKAEHRRAVQFAVHAPGEKGPLYLVGSAPELGAWNATEGLGPVPASGSLRSELPVGAVVEYKLVARPAGGAPRWESGANRIAFVGEGDGPMNLEVSWNAG